MAGLRRGAISQFAEAGFPTARDEEWRFTGIAPIARGEFVPATRDSGSVSPDEVALAGVPGLDSIEIVLVNGWFAPELSRLDELPKGVTVCNLADAIASDNKTVGAHLATHTPTADQPFAALNTAFLHDGAFIHIGRGVVLERPIEILNLAAREGDATICHPRHLIVAEELSQATILEHYEGSGDRTYFTNALAEIVVGAGAVVDYYRLQREGRRAYHTATTQVVQARDSRFTSTAVNLGASIMRHDIGMLLDGEGAIGVLNGLYMAGESQLTDTHTRIDHARPNCESHELYKGILADKARGVFNGRILVRPQAQKDKRQADEQEPAALAQCAREHQPPAGNLRRRCEVHARRHHRAARRAFGLLPAFARHPRGVCAPPAHLCVRQ